MNIYPRYPHSHSSRQVVKNIIMLVCAITLLLSLAEYAKSISLVERFDIPVEQGEAIKRQEVTAESYQAYWQKAGVVLQSVQPPCAEAIAFPATLQ